MVVFLGKWQNLDIFIARRSKIIPQCWQLCWPHTIPTPVKFGYFFHYSDVIMSSIASQITDSSVVYLAVSGAHQIRTRWLEPNILCAGTLFLPEACFGLRELSLPACIHICVCVCLSVCPCIRQSRACPRDKWPVKASITKFWPEVRNNLVKIPIVLRGWSTLTSSVKFNFKIRFYPILSLKFVCMITHHLIKLDSPNLEQRCETPCLRSLLFLEVIIKRVNIPLLG